MYGLYEMAEIETLFLLYVIYSENVLQAAHFSLIVCFYYFYISYIYIYNIFRSFLPSPSNSPHNHPTLFLIHGFFYLIIVVTSIFTRKLINIYTQHAEFIYCCLYVYCQGRPLGVGQSVRWHIHPWGRLTPPLSAAINCLQLFIWGGSLRGHLSVLVGQ